MSIYLIIFIITIVGIILLSLLAYLVVIKLKKFAEINKHLTTLGNEQGKIIMKEGLVVDIISKMKDAYYDASGELNNGQNPKNYGSLFKEFGIIFFGISPINEIYNFSTEWKEYVEKEASQIKKGEVSYEIIKKKENIDYFKRYYAHAIQILRVEMKDGSKIDLVFTVNFEILNIIQVIFKIKPDGIILAQAEIAFSMAILDEIRNYEYQEFRDNVDKSSLDSEFVEKILTKTNKVINEKFELNACLMELNFFDLSKGEPGDEDFEKAQKAKKLADINGDARIKTSQKNKEAMKIDGEGKREYFEEIAKVIGAENIAKFANLEQVKDTQLLSYGENSTPITPVVNITQKKKGSTS